MRKSNIRALILSIALVGASLSGCAQPAAPLEAAGELQTASADADEETTEEAGALEEGATEAVEEESAEDGTLLYNLEGDAQTDKEMKEILLGSWAYYGPNKAPSGDVKMDITFYEDGTLELVNHGVDDDYHHEGTWELECMFREDQSLSDLLEMQLTKKDKADPAFELLESLGDFLYDNVAVWEQDYVMGWRQTNNGDSVTSYLYQDVTPVWYKTSDKYPYEVPEITLLANETCGADLWRVEEYDGETYLYLTPYANRESKLGIVSEYYVASDEEGEVPVDALSPYSKITIQTDEDGDIVGISKFKDAFDLDIEAEYGIEPAEGIVKDYVRKKVDRSVDVKKLHVESYFEKPVFIGSDKRVKWLNGEVSKIADALLPESTEKEIREMINDWGEAGDQSEFYQYKPYHLTGVYYDENDNVSIGWRWDWFMGGVSNFGYEGYNINLDTKKKITMEDLMDMSHEYVLQEIADEIAKEYPEFAMYSGDDLMNRLEEFEEFEWHYDAMFIYVGFESYSLDQGGGPIEIQLSRSRY